MLETESAKRVLILIDSWKKKLEAATWISCPCCTSEYTYLHPCAYLDDEKKELVAHLCFTCAHTLVGWDWLMFSMPLPTSFLTYTKWTSPRYRRVGPKEDDVADMPQNAYVVVEVAGMEIIAKSEGGGKPIRYKIKGQDDVHTASNIYQLRSKFVHTLPY